MNDTTKRRALGRGLDSLLPPAPPPAAREPVTARIEELHPNPSQPRTSFDEVALAELADSLKEVGFLEPILVRTRRDGGYEIVAGERRWRAAQRAGLKEVPIYVRTLSEQEAFEAALVENLQRENLNPVETSRAFQRLIEEHEHTQESIAARLGKDRSTVANALRLLKLPSAVLEQLESGALSEGHGRALLGAPDSASMQRLAREAVTRGWSVRETERQARGAGAKKTGPSTAQKSVNVRDLEERLSRALGTRVRVADRKGKGRLELSFSSYDELDRLIERLAP